MSGHLTNIGGQAILKVVQGQDETWQQIISSNNTLQSVYVSDRAGSTMSMSVLTKLQSITTVNPHRTLQSKAWNYIDSNIEDLSAIRLEVKLVPHFLSFLSARGGVNSFFQFLHSRSNNTEFFSNPTPERLRSMRQMEKTEQQNMILRALLKSEMAVSQTIRMENNSLRDLKEDEQHQRNAMIRCVLLPLFKCFETWQSFMELLKERHAQSGVEVTLMDP